MVDHVGFLSPKCHQASQPSQQALNGKLVVSFTPMPSCALASIHPPIIPILPSLFRLIISSFFGSLTFFHFTHHTHYKLL